MAGNKAFAGWSAAEKQAYLATVRHCLAAGARSFWNMVFLACATRMYPPGLLAGLLNGWYRNTLQACQRGDQNLPNRMVRVRRLVDSTTFPYR